MAELHHECGIAAVYLRPGSEHVKLPNGLNSPDQAARMVPRMLLDMQNRGQLAAGMTSYSESRSSILATHKDLGTVAEAFRLNAKPEFEALMQRMGGPAAIGHVRYATCGTDDREASQPFERDHGRKFKWFAFAFNGQLTNYAQLKKEMLADGGYHLKRDLDTEIILHSISHELQAAEPPIDWVRVFANLARRFDGAYNIVLLTANGEMIVARDPLGIRPLCFAEEGPLFAAASESVPLANLGFHRIRSLEPGQMAIISPEGIRFERFAQSERHAHCFFEWIYFANVASTLDERSVYLSRAMLGRELARLEDVQLDQNTIVVPVPDTAKAAADAMAYSLGVPSVEGLMRNRYLGRTFIEGNADRATKARLKYTPLPDVLKGKRVLLVEDSIVRSTTMRALVHEIRNRGGASEIHLRIACPPIVAPCYYGIDMSQRAELFAPKFLDETGGMLTAEIQAKMAADLGADSLRYLPVEALSRSVGLPPERLCQACVTGDYPTQAGEELYQIDLSRELKQNSVLVPGASALVGGEINGENGHRRAYES
jgi:amidophosphoribosyltransferase